MPFGRSRNHYNHVPGNSKFVRRVYGGKSIPAHNTKNDHRVTDPRAKRFIRRFNTNRPGRLESQLDKHLKVSSGHEFHHRKWNRENLIHHRRGVNSISPPHYGKSITPRTKLINVMRLYGDVLEILFNDAADLGVDIESVKNQLRNNTLTPELKSLIASAHRKFLQKDVNKRRIQNLSPRIAWATLADEFQPYVNQGAPAWLDVLGLGHHLCDIDKYVTGEYQLSAEEAGLGLCFAIFEYEVGYVSALARPCVLDAGAYEWHQVSSVNRPLQAGGETKVVRSAPRPVSEFIHPIVIIKPEHVQMVSIVPI